MLLAPSCSLLLFNSLAKWSLRIKHTAATIAMQETAIFSSISQHVEIPSRLDILRKFGNFPLKVSGKHFSLFVNIIHSHQLNKERHHTQLSLAQGCNQRLSVVSYQTLCTFLNHSISFATLLPIQSLLAYMG
ncbi:hypothetical protein L208DRAFT_1551474 [Tricholoma matsutake]|nr:hypothetical protein L208DRAFT_1551474 [Tricholoma matsutake 945]